VTLSFTRRILSMELVPYLWSHLYLSVLTTHNFDWISVDIVGMTKNVLNRKVKTSC
jgi:hypothetical protein